MKVGDTVRVIKIPPGLVEGKLKTKTVFRRCLGKVFPIVGFQKKWVMLDVGEVVGRAPYMETIWIEPEYIELVKVFKKQSTKRVTVNP
jgi:hypothetical protein